MNYQAMAMAQRINELQALGGLPGNTVDVSQQVSNMQTMLLNIISARNDVDRVSGDNTTVINGGTLSDGTQIVFNATSLDAMDRVLGAYLTQLMPYMASPPPNFPAALSRSYLHRSPIVGLVNNGRLRSRLLPPRKHKKIGDRSNRPLLVSSPFSSVKNFLGWLTTAANLSGAAATYQAWAASGNVPPGSPPGTQPDQNLLDSVSAVAGGMSGMLGFYSQTLAPGSPAAVPVNAASALLGAISGGASLLNDFGHELGAFAYVIAAGDDGDPAVLADAWQEINDKGTHAGIDAVQTELSLFTFGVNAEGSPLYSSALNTFGANFANWMQTSAQAEDGVVNGGLQAAGLWANYQAFLLDGGMETLSSVDAYLEDEANKGAINLTNAFGEVVGDLDISYPSTEFPPLSGVDLTSDYSDEFDSMAGTDGNFIVYVPLGDPNFDYSNADLSAVDPLGDDAEIGSANIDLSNLNSQSPSKAPTISGTCSDDDSDDPDSDDPDCDNLGWIPALGNHRIYVAFRAPAINPATNGTQFQELDKLRASISFPHYFRGLTGKYGNTGQEGEYAAADALISLARRGSASMRQIWAGRGAPSDGIPPRGEEPGVRAVEDTNPDPLRGTRGEAAPALPQSRDHTVPGTPVPAHLIDAEFGGCFEN